MAGIGHDACAVQRTGAGLKSRLSWAEYGLALVGEIARKPFPMKIQIDDEPPSTRLCWALLAGNVPVAVRGIPIYPQAVADDTMLQILEVAPRSGLDWLEIGKKGLRGQAQDIRSLRYRPCRRAVVGVDHPIPVHIDGDVIGYATELELGIAGSVNVMVGLPSIPHSAGRCW